MKLNKHKLGGKIHSFIKPHIFPMIALDTFQVAFSQELNFQCIYFRIAYAQ